MTTADTTTAILSGIEATSGDDLVAWAALCDHLAESGDLPADPREAFGVSFLCLVTRAALVGHRHRLQAVRLLQLAGQCGVLRTARTITALCAAQGRKVELSAPYLAITARRWPYTGHSTINPRQRRIYDSWIRAVESADGVERTRFDDALGLIRILCYTVGEMLDAETYPVLAVTAECVTVLVRGERVQTTWDEIRAAKSQTDIRLLAVYSAIDEQARRIARELGIYLR